MIALTRFLLLLSSLSLCHTTFTHTYPTSDLLVNDIWENFELRLQDEVFKFLEESESQQLLQRVTRTTTEDNSWTGFVPSLNQHREQLIVKTVKIESVVEICSFASRTLLDSVELYENSEERHYTLAVCNDNLNLYRQINSSSLVLLDSRVLSNPAVELAHVKLFDPESGQVHLFFLILTAKSLEIYSYHGEKLELSQSQETLNQYSSVKVFDLDGVAYGMLVKVLPNNRTQTGFFKLALDSSNRIDFHLVSSKSLPGSTAMRVCAVEGRGYFFKSNQGKLNVYLFDRHQVKYQQIIDAPRTTAFECFRIGATHYLAVASISSLQVYRHSNGAYRPLNTLSKGGVLKIVPLSAPTYRDDTLLMVFGRNFVDFLVLDAASLSFQPLNGDCSRQVTLSDLPQTFDASSASCLMQVLNTDFESTSTTFRDNQVSVILSRDQSVFVLNVDVQWDPAPNPVLKQIAQVEMRLNAADFAARKIEALSQDFLDFAEGLVLYDRDVHLEGSWRIGELKVPLLPVDNLDRVDFNPAVWSPGMDLTIAKLQTEIDALEALVDEIDARLQGSILNATVDVVDLVQLAVDGSLLVDKLKVTNLTVQQLNGLDFDSTAADVVLRNSSRTIASVEIVGKLTTDSLTAKKVNGIPMSDVVTTDGPIHVNGNLTIANNVEVRNNVAVGGKVNNLDLSEQLMTQERQFDSLVFFSDVQIDQLIVDGYLDGVEAARIMPNVVYNLTSEPEFYKARFENLVIDGDLEIASNRVGDVDIVSLNANALRLNADDQVVNGSLVFAKGVLLESMLGVGSLNGIKFEDLILKDTDLSQVTMTGEKTFTGPIRVRWLVVNGTINGHHLDNVFTLDMNQSATGNPHFTAGFRAPDGDIQIGTLNGADWTSMIRNGVHPALLAVPGLTKNVTIRNPCSIGGSLATHITIDGEDLGDILDDLVYADDDMVTVTGTKTLASWEVNDLEVLGFVNGYKMLDDILTSTTHQNIAGRYQLLQGVEFASLNVAGRINEYKPDELLGSVLRFDGSPQTISSRLQFERIIVSEQFLINGSINGVFTDRMLLDGEYQNFTAPQTLISPSFSRLIVNGNIVTLDHTSLFNGVDLDLFDRRRVTLSTDQWISSNWTMVNATASSLSMATLNGLTMDQLCNTFIRSNSALPQTIDAQMVDLDLLVVYGNVSTSSGVNGYNLAELNRVAGNIQEDLFFSSDVAFDQLRSQEMLVGGLVNQHALHELKEQAVYTDRTQVIAGTKTFHQILVSNDVKADAINGGKLVENYLHATADQIIDTPIKFVDHLTASDLRLLGDSSTVNGVPSEALFSSQTLTHNVHRGDLIIQRPVRVDSLETSALQGENWNQLVASIAMLNQSNEFNGTITFTNFLEVTGALNAHQVNGIDPVAFAADVVLRDAAADITAKKIFTKLEAGALITPQVYSASVEPDVVGVEAGAIHLDRNEIVEGTTRFGDLRVSGDIQLSALNGRPFPAEYVTLDREQELPGRLTMNRLVVLGNITMADGARVNGFNLKAECDNTWMVDGDRKIESNKTFHGHLNVMKNVAVSHRVNGVANVSGEVVELAKGGTIYGAAHFTEIVVEGNVTGVGLTNDIDLAGLAAQTLYLDEGPIATMAEWSVPKVAVNGDQFLLPVEANVNSLPVGQLVGSPEALNRTVEVEARELYEAVHKWHDAFKLAYFKMDHLDLVQTLFLTHQATSVSTMRFNRTSLLLVGTRAGSMIFCRQPDENTFSLAGIPTGMGSVSKWLPLESEYFVALSKPTPLTAAKGATLWKVDSAVPLRLRKVHDFGPDVVDITGEGIHNLRFTFSDNTTTRSLALIPMPGAPFGDHLQVYNRPLSPAITSSSVPFSSDYRTHTFRLGSRQMIALIMAFSPDVSANIVGCPGVRLYSTSTGSMKLEHIIPACDVRAITTFTHGNLPDDYLLLAEHEAVTVYRYEGASGFVECFRLPYPSATALHSFVDYSTNFEGDFMIAVAKADRVAVHKAITIGDYLRV